MKIITCDPATVTLIVPLCAEAPTSAHLHRRNCATYELTATPDPDDAQTLILSGIPTDALRGVYRLSIATPCGCYETRVFLDLCQAPRLPSVHTPTADTYPITECCDEPEA